MTARTFADLQAAPTVTAIDLRDTLRNYAVSGSAIAAEVVLDLIARTELDGEDLGHLAESGQIGRDRQARLGHTDAAAAYDAVNAALDTRTAELGSEALRP